MVGKGSLSQGLYITVYMALILNVAAIAVGIIANFGFLPRLGGILFVLALCINIAAIFFNFATLDRNDEKGKLLKNLCYGFMVFSFFALFLLLYKQLIFIIEMDLTSRRYLISEIIQKAAYFGILGFGLIISILNYQYLDRSETWLN